MTKTTDEDRCHGSDRRCLRIDVMDRRLERGSCRQWSWYSFQQILLQLLEEKVNMANML